MKNIRLLGLAVGALATSAQVHAESSVTLYGLIDDSVQYVHNTAGQSSQISLQSGNVSVTKWGLKGSEDLGGGLQTVFKLESGFDVNSGVMAGSGFNRQSYVGIKSDSFGLLTVGRQYDAVEDLVISVQPNDYLYYFTAPGDVDNADGAARVNSAVKWTSPVWEGIQMEGTYSFGGVAGSTGSGQSYSAAVAYESGTLKMAAGYLHIDNGNPTLSTRGTTTAEGIFFSAVNLAYSSASAVNIARGGASYGIGPVTLGGYYSFSEYLADGSSKFADSERYNNGSLFAVWQVTPAAMLEIGYDYLKSHGDSSATYQQATIAGDYFISKRTDFYAATSYGHASGTNGSGIAQAVIADSYAAAGKATQELVMIGIRHRF